MKLFLYEAKKILIKQYALFFFLLVIIFPLFSIGDTFEQDYGFRGTKDKNCYLELVSEMVGKSPEEIAARIDEYDVNIAEAKIESGKLYSAYSNGEIGYDEYLVKYSEICKITDYENALKLLIKRNDYVCADNANRTLIPPAEIPALEDGSINFVFLLCICFCAAYAVLIEKNGSGGIILKTTPNGQGRTMAIKVIILFIMVTLMSVILSVYNFISLSAQLPQEYMNAGICSVEKFAESPYTYLSITDVFVISRILRTLGYLMICAAVMFTAYFSKSYTASVFPYIAVPLCADYVAMRGSQAYFLPTGLLKAIGYFYGDVYAYYDAGDPEKYFSAVPDFVFALIILVSVVIVVGAPILLIRSEKNRLMKRKPKFKKALLAVMSVMLVSLCSCSGGNNDALSYHGGSITLDGKVEFNSLPQNSKYYIDIVDTSTDPEIRAFRIKLIDKQTNEEKLIPFDAFTTQTPAIGLTLYPTENYYYFSTTGYSEGFQIFRLRFSDMTIEKIYDYDPVTTQKIVFGLTFSFDKTNLPSGQVFSDERNVFVCSGGLYKLNVFGDLELIIDDKITGGLEFDGDFIYYLNDAGELRAYDVFTGRSVLVTEEKVKPLTLDGDRENLYFETSDNIAKTVLKKDIWK